MHFTVFVWGFTAILGRLITLQASALVWYRTLIVVFVLFAMRFARKETFHAPARLLRFYALAGAALGLHWLLFYGCIKYAGIAIAVLCLSASVLFTALLEPLVFRRRPALSELVLGVVVIFGVSLLVRIGAHGTMTGLALGIGSAFFSAVCGSLNGKLAREAQHQLMTFYELLSAFLVASLYFVFQPEAFVSPAALSLQDTALLLVLAVGCTVLPWSWSLRALRTISAYTAAMTVTLEPVYSMAIAYVLFPKTEQLSLRFYGGSLLLLGVVALNGWLKRS